MDVQGACDPRFEAVKAAFEQNFSPDATFPDVGASVAVTLGGELVVDLWGGTIDTDNAAGVPWQSDTIVNVWSNTKTVAALACLMLADRGQLDLHAPVADVWPEFAANGKEGVLVRHVLSHTAGLPGWDPPLAPTDLYDWDTATGILAAQAPWWEPGTESGYHAVSQGYLEGEIVRRVTGAKIGDFIRSEVTGPLGIDFHIGTAAEHDARIAHVIPPEVSLEAPTDTIAGRTFASSALNAAAANTTAWRRAEIPAAGGHGNARSLAQIHAPMANGGTLGGVTILSPTGSAAVFEEQWNGPDHNLGVELRHGIGFGLPSATMPLPSERSCFWGGWGGSLTVVDLDRAMTFSYVMNRMGAGTLGDTRGAGLLLSAYGALDAM